MSLNVPAKKPHHQPSGNLLDKTNEINCKELHRQVKIFEFFNLWTRKLTLYLVNGLVKKRAQFTQKTGYRTIKKKNCS